MGITFFKILIIISTIGLILGFFGISISEKLPPKTSYFILPISTTITTIASSAIIFSLLYKLTKIKKEKAVEKEEAVTPLGELKSMLYKIETIERSGESLKNQAISITKQVFPYLSKIVHEYKQFLHGLPVEHRASFYEIYKSITGKHGHYWERRLMDDVKKLKSSVSDILRLYEQ